MHFCIFNDAIVHVEDVDRVFLSLLGHFSRLPSCLLYSIYQFYGNPNIRCLQCGATLRYTPGFILNGTHNRLGQLRHMYDTTTCEFGSEDLAMTVLIGDYPSNIKDWTSYWDIFRPKLLKIGPNVEVPSNFHKEYLLNYTMTPLYHDTRLNIYFVASLYPFPERPSARIHAADGKFYVFDERYRMPFGMEIDGEQIIAHLIRPMETMGKPAYARGEATPLTKYDIVSPSSAQKFFDRIQREHLVASNPTAGHRHITAPPGSGKSTLLLQIAKRWESLRFLMITFSKDLQKELEKRLERENVMNITVKTLDSLCYTAESKGHVNFKVYDYILCKEYRKRRTAGTSGAASVANRYLRSTCIDHSVLCPRHYAYLHDILEDAEAPGGDAYMRHTFSAYRKRTFRNGNLLSGYLKRNDAPDAILVDEVQDLDEQSLRSILNLNYPVTFVGDPNQKIFSFSDDTLCGECNANFEEHERIEGRALQNMDTYNLYVSYRHSPRSAHFICDVFGGQVRISSGRPSSELDPFRVHFINSMPQRNCLILARTNAEVIHIAMMGPSCVVEGNKIAANLKTLAKLVAQGNLSAKTEKDVPLLGFVRRNRHKVDLYCDILKKKNISLPDVESSRVPCVSTVHRTKGFEHPEVVVVKSLIDAPTDLWEFEDTGRIKFVAFSRQKTSVGLWYWAPPDHFPYDHYTPHTI